MKEETKLVSVQAAGADSKGTVHPATVEVQVGNKGVGIHIVGLADETAKESLLRVVTALQSLGFTLPGGKMIVNIAPSSLRKSGTGYDLPIAIGILLASGQIKVDEERLKSCVFNGELGLDGSIRQAEPYQGYALASSTLELPNWNRPYCLVTDKETALEASIVPEVLVYQFEYLPKLLRVLQQNTEGGLVGTANLIYLHKDYASNTTEWAKKVMAMGGRPL